MTTPRKKITAPRCFVCTHKDRHAIEMAQVAGASFRAIAEKYSTPTRIVSRSAIHRHVRDHVDEASIASYLADIPLEEIAARAAKEGMSLLDYFGLVRSTIIQQMLVASGVNDGHRVGALAGRAVEVLKEIGRLSGELTRIGSTISITNNVAVFADPKFIELQTGLLTIARQHPAARADIISLLRNMESPTTAKRNGAYVERMTLEHQGAARAS